MRKGGQFFSGGRWVQEHIGLTDQAWAYSFSMYSKMVHKHPISGVFPGNWLLTLLVSYPPVWLQTNGWLKAKSTTQDSQILRLVLSWAGPVSPIKVAWILLWSDLSYKYYEENAAIWFVQMLYWSYISLWIFKISIIMVPNDNIQNGFQDLAKSCSASGVKDLLHQIGSMIFFKIGVIDFDL